MTESKLEAIDKEAREAMDNMKEIFNRRQKAETEQILAMLESHRKQIVFIAKDFKLTDEQYQKLSDFELSFQTHLIYNYEIKVKNIKAKQ